MKEIHPKYYAEAKVVCNCGNTFTTGSTLPEIEVEICSNCHPFYTGTQKLIDTEGRVERFEKKVKVAQKAQAEQTKKVAAKKQAEEKKRVPRTLKEMIEMEKAKAEGEE